MRSILVTGGAGFIGSHFVRAFMQRHPRSHVHVLDALTYAGDLDNLPASILDHPRFRFWYGNVCDAELVGEVMSKVDTVIHFAAESHVARSIASNRKFYETDVMGTQVIASQILKHGRRIKRFVHISTSEVYGTALTEPMAEDHPLMPNSPYASAKCGADRLVYSYWRTYAIPAVIVRPFNQYGPSQHLEKCIPRFVTSALTDAPLTLHGDGTAARDWCYVADTCQALLTALEVPLDAIVGEVINLGTGVPTDVQTISRKILERIPMTRSPTEHIYNRPGQVDLHVSATTKARRLLDWQASTDLDTGLDRTIQWYRENEAWWRKRQWIAHVPLETPGAEIVYH
jgi:dTDP-glucose 4,6-dehydratase